MFHKSGMHPSCPKTLDWIASPWPRGTVVKGKKKGNILFNDNTYLVM